MIQRRAVLAAGLCALAAPAAAAPSETRAWIAYETRLRARLADAGGGRFDLSAARALLGLTNTARAAERTAPVDWSEDLAETARAHAADLAGRGYVEHLSPEGFDPSDRLGLVARRMIGSTSENIAYHQGPQPADAGRLMGLWRSSPNHWRNLLSGRHSHAGFGVVRKADRVYAVGLYARPDGTLAHPLAFHVREVAEVSRAAADAGSGLAVEGLGEALASRRWLPLEELAAARAGVYQLLVQRRLDARTYAALSGPIFVWAGGMAAAADRR